MTNTQDLSHAAIFEKPIHIDWSEGYQERWELVYPDVEIFNIKNIVSITSRSFENVESGRKYAREYFDENLHQIEPMMNYYYPLPYLQDKPETAQAILLKNHNVCSVVLVEEEPVLALSGGGMDFSWDICRAYILLGYLPPFHFCDLPKMAGHEDEEVRTACMKTCTAVSKQALARYGRLCDL